MSIFYLILGSVLLGDAAWWLWADRRLARARRPVAWRVLLGVFMAMQLGYLSWMIAFPLEARQSHGWMPAWGLALIYIWHLVMLPAGLLMGLGRLAWRGGRAAGGWLKRRREAGLQEEDFAAPSPATLSRREALLTAAAVAVPPLLTAGAVGWSVPRLGNFRIRRIEVPLAALPRELDGMRIAHVSDVHIGRFTRAEALPAIAEATNALKADLVLLTGDLIDLSLSDLPAAMNFVRMLDPRRGLFICEGNHDLIENRYSFEWQMKDARLPLLLDESGVVEVRGRPVQVMGLSWGRRESEMMGALGRLNPQRRPDAFQVLLAHHPHAFDHAAAVGIPLTLAGHTHGGQMMLSERIGPGPMMFKYWSGLYRRPGEETGPALVVSNGVGNWFPLRVNAPAEVVEVTLRAKGEGA